MQSARARFVSCRHHLALDVNPRNGTLRLAFPDVDLIELPATCSLDVADLGGGTLDDLAKVMNVVKESVRSTEEDALAKFRSAATRIGVPIEQLLGEAAE